MRSLFAYDLIGFQAQQDVQHFEHYVRNEAHGQYLGDDMYRAYGQHGALQRLPDRHRRGRVRGAHAREGIARHVRDA